MTKDLDIVNLIEKNPITRLSKDYQNTLINKIKARFSENQQQLFAGSFYCYLNHHPKKDFVINLNDVWKWIGFARKDNAKKLLEKYFIEEIDYKISLRQLAERKKERGGQNKEDKRSWMFTHPLAKSTSLLVEFASLTKFYNINIIKFYFPCFYFQASIMPEDF